MRVQAGPPRRIAQSMWDRHAGRSATQTCMFRIVCHACWTAAYICRARTDVLGHSSNPEWEEQFEILVADEADELSFTVKDDNWIGQHLVC